MVTDKGSIDLKIAQVVTFIC